MRNKLIIAKCKACDRFLDDEEVQVEEFGESAFNRTLLTFKCPHCKVRSTTHMLGR